MRDLATRGNQLIKQDSINPTDRHAFERLLRKLLNYKNRPAVVLLNAFKWKSLLQRDEVNGVGPNKDRPSDWPSKGKYTVRQEGGWVVGWAVGWFVGWLVDYYGVVMSAPMSGVAPQQTRDGWTSSRFCPLTAKP